MKYLAAFGRFWWEFLVGDTPEVAVGALGVLGIAWMLTGHSLIATVALPLAVFALLVGSLLIAVRRR
jgi:hypothetical protein